MYELVQAGPRSFYINGPAKTGVFSLDARHVCVIDSGSDKEAGKRVGMVLDQKGWNLYAIINTHSNTDHTGGSRYLQQKTGCRIYARCADTSFITCPYLNPAFLYRGYPFEDMHHKFLVEAGCQVRFMNLIAEDKALRELKIIPLPGQFFQMTGVGTPDGTIYLADCLHSRDVLDKYRIPAIHDVASYLGTLDRVMGLDALFFVPAHAPAMECIRELARYNRQCVLEVADKVAELCSIPRTLESVLKAIFDHYGLSMTFQHHVRAGSTVRACLSWLKDTGQLRTYKEGNRTLWCV